MYVKAMDAKVMKENLESGEMSRDDIVRKHIGHKHAFEVLNLI